MPGVREQAQATFHWEPVRRWLGQVLEKHHHLILLLGFPLLLIGINSNWVFTPIYSLDTHDPWFYTAYLLRYFEYAPVFPSSAHYFAERLVWLIPGHMVYRLLPHLTANYVLHLAVYYVGVGALYGTLTRLSDRRVAFLSALTLGSYPWFLRAAGWDYPDGAGIAQMLLLLYLLTLAASGSRWRHVLLMFAGALFPALLSTHMFWVGLMPGAALYFVLLSRRAGDLGGRRLLTAGGLFIAGALIMAGLLAVVHQASSGNYSFLQNSLRLSRELAGVSELRRANMSSYGAYPPFPNVIPILLSIVCIVRLSRGRRGPRNYVLLAAAGNFALSYGFLVLTSGVTQYPVLFMFPYTSYVIPSAFILLGLILEGLIRECSRVSYAWAVLLALLLQPLALALSVGKPGILELQGNWQLLAFFSILLVYSLSAAIAPQRLLLALLSIWAIGFVGGKHASVFIKDPWLGRNGYMAVMQARDLIDAQYPEPTYGDVRFWPRWTDDVKLYLAIEALYLYPWGVALENVPHSLYEWPPTAPVREGAIILIDADPDPLNTLSEANAAVAHVNAQLEMTGHRRIRQGDLAFTILFTQLRTNPPQIRYGERFEFDEPMRGTNVYPRETGLQGETYVWTGPGTRSDLTFALAPPSHDLDMRICVRSVLRPKIARSFGLLVNSVPIRTTLHTDADGCPWLYTGTIPASVVSDAPGTTVLTIEVGRTVGPDKLGISLDDHRSLGLSLDWMEIR